MDRIKEIYHSLIQNAGYMSELDKKMQEDIVMLLGEEAQKGWREYEEYRDRLFGAAAIAEEVGFIKGFKFAAELLAECVPENRKVNLES